MARGKSLRMMIETEDPLFLGMKKLKIQGKELTAVPPELYNINELEVLDMSPEREACLYYKLQEVPVGLCKFYLIHSEMVGKLANLKVLMLDTNDLRSLPPEIGQLQNLERIALSNNFLNRLPAEFVELRNLRSLHMANNKIEHFPDVITKLDNIEFLDLSDNMIVEVPKSIRNMRKLETLLLFENKLTFLPDEICELIQLRCIWLGHNKISKLPRYFGRLTLLDWSWHYTSTTLDGNPLVHPPIDVCKKGSNEIERYFKGLGNIAGGSSAPVPPAPQFSGKQTLDFNPEAMRHLRRGSSVQPIPDMSMLDIA